jgi:undecaprenyl-diphosphatase
MLQAPTVFLNTHGILVLVLFIIIYELFVVRDSEVAWHIIFSVLATLVFTIVLKELFLIPRPYYMPGVEAHAGLTQFSSFPSTHTAVAFVLATSVTLHQKTLGVFLFTMAALIGVGRVLANVHYPIDVILGMFIGVLTGVIFNQIHLNKRKKRNTK